MPSANSLPHSIDVSEPSERVLQRAKSLLALGLLPDEAPMMVGDSFGDYEILEELGRGSSGVVYRARHAGIHGSSETKDRLVFAFSVPVLDERGLAVGVLIATLNAKSVFGAVRMADSAGGRHITSALLGPRGADRGAATIIPTQAPYTFLVHPSLPAGTEHVLPATFASQLRRAFGSSAHPGKQFGLQYVPPVKVADYYDAIPGSDGRWLAAFAPVGNTGFVVLVQTPHDAMLSWPQAP